MSSCRAATQAIQFTVDQASLKKKAQNPASANMTEKPVNAVLENNRLEKEAQMAKMICTLENKDACLMCGS